MEEKIDSTDTLIRCSYIIRNSYYLTFLKYIKEYLSLQDFSLLLGKFWTEEENPNGDVNVSVSLAARWFRLADKKSLMYDDEYEDDCVIQKKHFVYLPSVKFMGAFNMRMMMSMVDAQYN